MLLQVSVEIKHLEARFSGSIKRIQLDNQMLDATQPVVLAPATVAHAHSKTAQALTGQDSALIEFGIARSFANTVLRGGEQVGPWSPCVEQFGHLGSNLHPKLVRCCLPSKCTGMQMGRQLIVLRKRHWIWLSLPWY